MAKQNYVHSTTQSMLDGIPMSNSSTGVRGVTQLKQGRNKGRFCADIFCTGYKRLWLGVYDTLDEAQMVRAQAQQMAKGGSTMLMDWFDNQLQNEYKGVPYRRC